MRTRWIHLIGALFLLVACAAQAANISIRDDRILEVDGERFFPVGLLELGPRVFPDWNERIRQSGANVVWDFEIAYQDTIPRCSAVMDSAEATGYRLLMGSPNTLYWDDPATPELEVTAPLYSESKLTTLFDCAREHPNVILGYTNRDEPAWTIAQGWIGDIDGPHVHDTYQQLRTLIPNTFVAMNFAPANLSNDFDTWQRDILPFFPATDVVMHAAYPYPYGPGTCGPVNVLGYPDCTMDRLADNADLFLEIIEPDQPLWMIVQAFKDIPRKEARWQAYASIVHGATGLFWAGWTWVHPLGDGEVIWPRMAGVVSEVASLHDFLVGDVLSGAESSHADVEVLAKEHQRTREAIVFAIGRNGFVGEAMIRLPDAGSTEITVVNEGRTLRALDGWITDDFNGYEAHVYRYDRGPSIEGLESLSLQVFPNPTVDGLEVRFVLPVRTRVEFVLYDAAGRRVAKIGEGTFAQGAAQLHWSRTDEENIISTGVYFLRAETAAGQSDTERVLIR